MAIYHQEKILTGTTIKNKRPANLISEDNFLFENDLTTHLPEARLNYFKKINVTPHGILFNRMHIYKQFLIWGKHEKEFNLFYLIRNYLKRKKIVSNPSSDYIICFDYWSMGYFHWMCDFLPRLMLVEDKLNDYTLLLPDNHKNPYVEGSLKIFDIKNIAKFSSEEYVSCEKAIVPDYVSKSGDNHPEIMNKLRTKFLNYYKPTHNADKYAKNIYVSRAKAKGRFIINETEVTDLLKIHDFKIIYFEEYTFAEQINIAYNCKNMVGLHGANLVNMLFMNPQSNVLELRTKNDHLKNYYFLLASTFNLNYFYLQCEPDKESDPEALNLTVDINALKIQLTLMLNN